MSAHRGNSRTHLLKQLQRCGRPDLVEGVRAGRLDVYTAAVAAGLRKRPPSLEILTNARKRREFALYPRRATRDQEMQFGRPLYGPSEFASAAEAKKYWRENRPRLWPMLCVNGKRPWAWWCFESPLPWPGSDRQTSVLYEAGLLSAEEEREVLTEWKAQFDYSFGRGFFYCEGPENIVDGIRGRFAHYRWADIPATLVRQWIRERQRAIRELAKATGTAA